MPILADTGGVLVLLDRKDPKHQAAVASLDQKLIVPSIILAEVDYLASRRLAHDAMSTFLTSLFIGEFDYYEVDLFDLQRADEIMRQYADAHVGLVDATVVAVAERLRINRILTIDRRHFSMFKPRNLNYLELLP